VSYRKSKILEALWNPKSPGSASRWPPVVESARGGERVIDALVHDIAVARVGHANRAVAPTGGESLGQGQPHGPGDAPGTTPRINSYI